MPFGSDNRRCVLSLQNAALPESEKAFARLSEAGFFALYSCFTLLSGADVLAVSVVFFELSFSTCLG